MSEPNGYHSPTDFSSLHTRVAKRSMLTPNKSEHDHECERAPAARAGVCGVRSLAYL